MLRPRGYQFKTATLDSDDTEEAGRRPPPQFEKEFLEYCLVGCDVAIIEESVQIQTIMRYMLRQSDVGHIRLFSSLKVASKELRRYTPDLIILEWKTHPHRSADFLAWIRSGACKHLNNVPVVVTLFLPTLGTIEDIQHVGCDSVVAKPMSQKLFLKQCRLAMMRLNHEDSTSR